MIIVVSILKKYNSCNNKDDDDYFIVVNRNYGVKLLCENLLWGVASSERGIRRSPQSSSLLPAVASTAYTAYTAWMALHSLIG